MIPLWLSRVIGDLIPESWYRNWPTPYGGLRLADSFGELSEDCRNLVSSMYRGCESVGLRTSVSGAYRVVSTNPEEAIVDFDPDDTTQYLEGVDYPASKEDLASAAEGNGAPEELVERLRTLGRPTFSGPGEVVAELESSPTSG